MELEQGWWRVESKRKKTEEAEKVSVMDLERQTVVRLPGIYMNIMSLFE